MLKNFIKNFDPFADTLATFPNGDDSLHLLRWERISQRCLAQFRRGQEDVTRKFYGISIFRNLNTLFLLSFPTFLRFLFISFSYMIYGIVLSSSSAFLLLAGNLITKKYNFFCSPSGSRPFHRYSMIASNWTFAWTTERPLATDKWHFVGGVIYCCSPFAWKSIEMAHGRTMKW